VNVELARRAIELAKANPERFDMDSFSSGWEGLDWPAVKDGPDFIPPCGTTACFAGWVSYAAAPVGAKVMDSQVLLPGTDSEHVESYAAKALGITAGQADVLFYAPADLGEVETLVDYLAVSPDATYGNLHVFLGTPDAL
jgi:hypothetical protein